MGMRFRKSFGGKGFRVNVSKSGIGYSMGGKGFRYTKKAGGGSRTTASIPGTGVSYVKDSKTGKRVAVAQIYNSAPIGKMGRFFYKLMRFTSIAFGSFFTALGALMIVGGEALIGFMFAPIGVFLLLLAGCFKVDKDQEESER